MEKSPRPHRTNVRSMPSRRRKQIIESLCGARAVELVLEFCRLSNEEQKGKEGCVLVERITNAIRSRLRVRHQEIFAAQQRIENLGLVALRRYEKYNLMRLLFFYFLCRSTRVCFFI
jgi:hypothetical protein